MRWLVRFRREHRIRDLLERVRELARERIESFRERLRESIKKHTAEARERTERDTEKAKQFNLLARLRQKSFIEARDIFFKLETLRSYLIDVLLAQKVTSIDKITEAIKQGLSRVSIPRIDILYELSRCVARYQVGACNSKKYYVKLTYSTLNILRNLGIKFAVYVRSFIDNAKLRDRLLNAIALVIHALLRSRTKSRREHYNSEMLANADSTLQDSDSVTIMRSDVTQTTRSYSLAFLMRHLTLIARSLAVKLGLSEVAGDGGHCSIYAMPSYASRRKEYLNLDFQRYYDFIIFEDKQSMRWIS